MSARVGLRLTNDFEIDSDAFTSHGKPAEGTTKISAEQSSAAQQSKPGSNPVRSLSLSLTIKRSIAVRVRAQLQLLSRFHSSKSLRTFVCVCACVCALHNQCKHAMKLERIGIGTKRMGILLCTSLKSTISDWIGAGTGLDWLRAAVAALRELYTRTSVCVCVSSLFLALLVCVRVSECIFAVGCGWWPPTRVLWRRNSTVNAVYLFKKL